MACGVLRPGYIAVSCRRGEASPPAIELWWQSVVCTGAADRCGAACFSRVSVVETSPGAERTTTRALRQRSRRRLAKNTAAVTTQHAPPAVAECGEALGGGGAPCRGRVRGGPGWWWHPLLWPSAGRPWVVYCNRAMVCSDKCSAAGTLAVCCDARRGLRAFFVYVAHTAVACERGSGAGPYHGRR